MTVRCAAGAAELVAALRRVPPASAALGRARLASALMPGLAPSSASLSPLDL